MENVKLSEQLIELASGFLANKDNLQDLIEGLSESDFNKRPSYGGWSIGECISHLAVTDADYTSQIEKGLKKAKEKKLYSNGPFSLSWLGNKFVSTVEPPVKRKLKIPEKWAPQSSLSMKETIHNYLMYQDKYIDLVNESSGLDIGKVKLPSPATNLLRFSIYTMFCINSAHSRRHQWQAINVKKDIL
jgi:hypothetical protein